MRGRTLRLSFGTLEAALAAALSATRGADADAPALLGGASLSAVLGEFKV